jgi:hypothetical protein
VGPFPEVNSQLLEVTNVSLSNVSLQEFSPRHYECHNRAITEPGASVSVRAWESH